MRHFFYVLFWKWTIWPCRRELSATWKVGVSISVLSVLFSWSAHTASSVFFFLLLFFFKSLIFLSLFFSYFDSRPSSPPPPSSASHVAGTPRDTGRWTSVSHWHRCAKERLRLGAEAPGHQIWPGDLPANLEQRLLLSGGVRRHYRQVQWVLQMCLSPLSASF